MCNSLHDIGAIVCMQEFMFLLFLFILVYVLSVGIMFVENISELTKDFNLFGVQNHGNT